MSTINQPPGVGDKPSAIENRNGKGTLKGHIDQKLKTRSAGNMQLAQAQVAPVLQPPGNIPVETQRPGRSKTPGRIQPGPSANDNKPDARKPGQGRSMSGMGRIAKGVMKRGAVGAAALTAMEWNANREPGAVRDAVNKFGLNPQSKEGILAARAYVWGKNMAPRHYWDVPYQGERNEAVARALKDNELQNPGQLGKALQTGYRPLTPENQQAKKAIDQVVKDALEDPQRYLASAEKGDADKKDVKSGQQVKTETQPQTKPDECKETSPRGKTIPPSPEQVKELVDEHSQTNASPLTTAAAISIIVQTQPQGTRVEVAGEGVEGPDIHYVSTNGECDKDGKPRIVDTVQVKSISTRKGFEKVLRKEIKAKEDQQSRIIAVQVDTPLPDKDLPVSNWLNRYWGYRKSKNPDTWMEEARKQIGREILIVDRDGTTILRSPVFTLTD